MKVPEIVDSMLARGLTPQTIEHLTGLPYNTIAARPAAAAFRAQDEDLSVAMSNLIWQAHQRAIFLLHNARTDVQLRIIMGLLGPAARAVGKQDEAARARLLADFRDLIGAKPHGDAEEGDDPDEFDPSLAPSTAGDTDDR